MLPACLRGKSSSQNAAFPFPERVADHVRIEIHRVAATFIARKCDARED
jgi:hypothetical protein